jgi:hypothetical protein
MAPFFAFLAALLLLGHLEVPVAFKCGGPLTTDCLGDTSDIRYDANASDAILIKPKFEIWKKAAG